MTSERIAGLKRDIEDWEEWKLEAIERLHKLIAKRATVEGDHEYGEMLDKLIQIDDEATRQ